MAKAAPVEAPIKNSIILTVLSVGDGADTAGPK